MTKFGEFSAIGTATVAVAYSQRCWMEPSPRPAWDGASMAGRALTIVTGEMDNLAIHRGLLQASEGDVLVVEGGGSAAGFWGEILSVAAVERGIVGLVIHGGVRDTPRLSQLAFPVFSTSVSVASTAKEDAGRIGEPVHIGGIPVRTGDCVIADSDAVVVIPESAAESVLERCRIIKEEEDVAIDRIRRGFSTLEALGFER